ncbi:MAG: hypothetical protein IJZ16_10390, partial [Clostridia bacterium]|nr:hypothetical protein [Clostridia bacterium]
MKKIFGILMAIAVIATASTVVASATNNEVPALPDTGTTEKDKATPEETTAEEVSDNAETATTDVEKSTEADETTVPESSEGAEGSDNTDSESNEEVESATFEVLEDGETVEDDSEAVNDEVLEIPQTGDKRKFLPAVATFIVSGIALAYCVVKGKKIKKT